MTKTRFQPFCRANNINLRHYDAERIFLRRDARRDNALFLRNTQFCLVWKSEGVKFNQALKK